MNELVRVKYDPIEIEELIFLYIRIAGIDTTEEKMLLWNLYHIISDPYFQYGMWQWSELRKLLQVFKLGKIKQ